MMEVDKMTGMILLAPPESAMSISGGGWLK
jgi:hypothetical protein